MKKELSQKLLDKIKYINKNSFEIISLNLRNNQRSFFDLFLDVSPMQKGQKPSYNSFEYDDVEIDPYMPPEYQIKYQDQFPNSKGGDIPFYLNNEKEPVIASRLYLGSLVSQARNKSPYRINKGFEATYDVEAVSSIKDVSNFRQDLTEILCQAIDNGNGQLIYRLLSKTEIDLNRAGRDGRVPLHAILDNENIEIYSFKQLVGLLINRGADINQKNQITGETFLHKALNQKEEYAQFIVDNIEGVKIDTEALIIAIENNHWNITDSFLRDDDLLDKEELDLNEAREDGVTPLIMAAAKDNSYDYSVTKKLLSYGVDPNQENIETGETPLSVAVGAGSEELLKILLEVKGIKIDENLLDQSLNFKINEMLLAAFNKQKEDKNFTEPFNVITQTEYEKSTKIKVTLEEPKENFQLKINPDMHLEAEDGNEFKIKIENKSPKTSTKKTSSKSFSFHKNENEI